MKKAIKVYAIIVACVFSFELISCSGNKIDKMQDEQLKVFNMVEKAVKENNTSREIINALQQEAPAFQEAFETLASLNKENVELTEKQKRKAAEIRLKSAKLFLDRRATPYMRLVMPF